MSKQEGKELLNAIKQDRKERQKAAMLNSTPVLVLKGAWTLAEGASLMICSAFAIYQGWYMNLPTWGSYVLIVAGVLVAVPAGILLGAFCRRAARS